MLKSLIVFVLLLLTLLIVKEIIRFLLTIHIVFECFGLSRKKCRQREVAYAPIRHAEMGHRQLKLQSSQRNIAGRIKRAFQDCIPSNYQWAHRLRVDPLIENEMSTISIIDLGAPNPARSMVTKVTISCRHSIWTPQVRIKEVGDDPAVFTTDPNDPELTLLIGRQLDFIRTWQPESKPVPAA